MHLRPNFTFLIVSISLLITTRSAAQNIAEGESLFKQKCTACHAIDRDMIGPRLASVNQRHDEEWLIPWIRNSQAMIAAGDETAVALFEGHNNVVMTAFPELSDDNIRNILAYVEQAENQQETSASAAANLAAGNHQQGGGSALMNLIVVGFIIVTFFALLAILLLSKVIKTLERQIQKTAGKTELPAIRDHNDSIIPLKE